MKLNAENKLHRVAVGVAVFAVALLTTFGGLYAVNRPPAVVPSGTGVFHSVGGSEVLDASLVTTSDMAPGPAGYVISTDGGVVFWIPNDGGGSTAFAPTGDITCTDAGVCSVIKVQGYAWESYAGNAPVTGSVPFFDGGVFGMLPIVQANGTYVLTSTVTGGAGHVSALSWSTAGGSFPFGVDISDAGIVTQLSSDAAIAVSGAGFALPDSGGIAFGPDAAVTGNIRLPSEPNGDYEIIRSKSLYNSPNEESFLTISYSSSGGDVIILGSNTGTTAPWRAKIRAYSNWSLCTITGYCSLFFFNNLISLGAPIVGNGNDPYGDTTANSPYNVHGYGTVSVAGSSNVTLTSSVTAGYGMHYVDLTGAITAAITVFFPSGGNGANWCVANSTTGAFTITAKVTSDPGSGVALPTSTTHGPCTPVWTDGTYMRKGE